MLRGLEVVKTNDIAQALNQTIQVQPLRPLLGIQLVRFLLASVAPSLLYTAVRLVRLINWITAAARLRFPSTGCVGKRYADGKQDE